MNTITEGNPTEVCAAIKLGIDANARRFADDRQIGQTQDSTPQSAKPSQ